MNSYVTGIKWVSPSGELMEASETKNPELLPYIRASYGLAGIVYEMTFKLKPIEIISFNYDVRDVDDLKDSIIKKAISENQSIVMWTVGDHIVNRRRGGRNVRSNYQALCQSPCHDVKTAREGRDAAQAMRGGIP